MFIGCVFYRGQGQRKREGRAGKRKNPREREKWERERMKKRDLMEKKANIATGTKRKSNVEMRKREFWWLQRA